MAIEAFARRDWEEVDRLRDTCDYGTFRVHGLAYFERLRGFQSIAMAHGIFVRDLVIAFLTSAWALSRGAEQSDESDDTPEPIVRAIAYIKARAKAWADFCAELAIDPAMPDFTYYKQSQDLVAEFEDVEADPEMYSAQLENLRGAWRHRLEHCRGARN